MGATIEGPLSGGSHGWAFGASWADPAAHGYVEEELAIAGTATTYRPIGELGFDGRWAVEPDGEVPFRTRVLVRRPVDPAAFSGTVFVVWGNVSSGFEMITWDTPEIYARGHVIVGVSVQTVALHGFDVEHPIGLTTWDPERYGHLHIPTDDASYDIFTQVALRRGPAAPRVPRVPAHRSLRRRQPGHDRRRGSPLGARCRAQLRLRAEPSAHRPGRPHHGAQHRDRGPALLPLTPA
jgi:hypothetical protein